MTSVNRRRLQIACVALFALLGAAPARAALHTYVVSELFTSVDGTVQFIELREASNAGGQNQFQFGSMVAKNVGGSQTHTFVFPSALISSTTAGTRVLLATAKFAMLPGAPTPDYIIPENFLFAGSGSIQFTGNGVTINYTGLPSDGANSLQFPGPVAGLNSPTNFNMGGGTGQTGAVNAPGGTCCNGAACTFTTQVACGGTWTTGGACGGGTCVPPPVPGRCCRGSTCVAVLAADCTAPAGVGATFFGAASNCNVASSATPCCFADFNKANNVSIDDIFIYLNAWFANSRYADISSNGAADPTIDDIFIYLNAWFAGCS